VQQQLDGVWTWRVWRPGSFRGVSFNGTYLEAGDERLVIDPPPLNTWELEHLEQLGGPTTVVITNANHLRAGPELRSRFGARLLVPAADRDRVETDVDGTFEHGDRIGPLTVVALDDQKTPGESALHWPERRLLILGDALIGAPRHGLSLLPESKFADPARAREGLRRLLDLDVDAVLVGDGESILAGGAAALRAFFGEVPEAALETLETTGGGRAPAKGGQGWYVVNLADAAWVSSDRFGVWSDLEGQRGRFRQLGLNVSILKPGKAACLYHRETTEESFLVLHGECRLLIEEQERALKQWDFVHCPPGTRHVFVGSEAPCAVLMVGTRDAAAGIHYPASELAARFEAAVATPTDDPQEAYGSLGLTRPQPVAQTWPLKDAHP
jgi:uncharacterized cupin superfamily protein